MSNATGEFMRQGQRWMPCRNMSKEIAPPYALMRLRNGDAYGGIIDSAYTVTYQSVGKSKEPGFPFVLGFSPDEDDLNSLDISGSVVDGYDVGLGRLFGQTNVGGQAVWEVLMPDAEAQYNQDCDFLVCNGPQPIESGGYGLCTQDWPARVLHHDTTGPNATYTNGLRLGPQNGSWCVWNRGTLEDSAFVLLSHDPTWPGADPKSYPNMKKEPDPNPHTVWVRGDNVIWRTYYSGAGGSPHAAGSIIPVTGAPFVSPAGVTNAHVHGVTLSGGGYLAASAGPYLFGFQATLSSETAPVGSKLGLKLYLGSTATSWEAYRLQDVEQDTNYSAEPILYTAENVACTGIVYLTAGQVVTVRSDSQYTMEVGGFSFWLASMA